MEEQSRRYAVGSGEWKAAHGYGARQAVVPLDPEVAREAEVDWGTAWVEMGGGAAQGKAVRDALTLLGQGLRESLFVGASGDVL